MRQENACYINILKTTLKKNNGNCIKSPSNVMSVELIEEHTRNNVKKMELKNRIGSPTQINYTCTTK